MSKSWPVVADAPLAETRALRPWNYSWGKRLFDLALAAVLLVLLSPLLLALAILVALESGGPVFFRQQRAGKNGRLFNLIKFRTMVHDVKDNGPRITRSGDARVTRLGKVLRKWKLDELPQLFNVIRGDMSVVGPRPDLPEFLAELTPPQNQILRLRPGITGMASICYRHEEELLSQVKPEELRRFYCTQVLPAKARIDLDYARQAGFLRDLGVLFGTLRATVTRTDSRQEGCKC